MATIQGQYKGKDIYAGDDAYIAKQMRDIDAASQPVTPAPQPAAAPVPMTTTAPKPAAQTPYTQPTQPTAAPATQAAPSTPAQPTNVPQQNLEPGAQGAGVNELQAMLQTLGYMTPQQISTGPGIYGPQTQNAVARLQKDLGVQTGGNAGFYGPKTRAALAEKYKGAFNQLGASQTPASQADARAALDGFLEGQGDDDIQRSYFEELFNMNPVESALFQQLTGLMNPQTQKQSFMELFAQETAAQGLPGLQMELADIKKIMDGTEDDIRSEITATGGFATDSQVKALTGARNKVLLREAQYLADVIQAKEAYVDKIVSLTQADRAEIDKQLDRKLGITTTLMNLTQSMQKNAAENYRNIISDVGYDGFAALMENDPRKMRQAESALGLPKGSLSDPDFLAMMQDDKEWGDPYMLGGDYVQENLNTGEIRVAVNVDKALGGSGLGGYGISPSGEDYDALVNMVSSAGTSVHQQKAMKEYLSTAIQKGDWMTAYQFVVQGTENRLTGENRTKFENAALDEVVLKDMREALVAYQAAGGNMNLFKGKADDIQKRIGVLATDPKYVEVATRLDRAFQQYRQNMTGAAFGAQESAQYASVLPQKTSNLDLNLAVIDGALGFTDSYVSGVIDNKFGPQAIQVKQKALQGTRAPDGMSDDDAYQLYLNQL